MSQLAAAESLVAPFAHTVAVDLRGDVTLPTFGLALSLANLSPLHRNMNVAGRRQVWCNRWTEHSSLGTARARGGQHRPFRWHHNGQIAVSRSGHGANGSPTTCILLLEQQKA